MCIDDERKKKNCKTIYTVFVWRNDGYALDTACYVRVCRIRFKSTPDRIIASQRQQFLNLTRNPAPILPLPGAGTLFINDIHSAILIAVFLPNTLHSIRTRQ
jgi:hypothetical protein